MYSRDDLNLYGYFKGVLDGRRITDVLDPLTGLVSRAHMLEFIKSLIEEKTPFTLGIIDLDNFKYINDTYGHTVGDEVLEKFSDSLREFLTGYGIAGRLGGDEFLFINFRDLSYAENKEFCLTLYGTFSVLRKSYKLTSYELFVTATTGMAVYPFDTDDFDELFSLIDKTLYRGKTKGRNCYIIYQAEKHKDIEIIKLKKNSLYEICRNLAAGFDSAGSLAEKLKAGFETVKNDLHLSDLYYIGKDREVKSAANGNSLGCACDINLLMKEDLFASNELSQIQNSSPEFFRILSENEIEAVLIMSISNTPESYGYLMCAEPHTMRIWQENEYTVMFLFARMLSAYLRERRLA